MTLRLPPRYYNTATKARFRKYRLPRELFYTWETVNALAWQNDYEFTPRVRNADLARLLDLEERALQVHTGKLAAWGWFEKIDSTRDGNVYRLAIPADTPASIGQTDSIDGRECGTDSAGEDPDAGADTHMAVGCSTMHPLPLNIIAAAVESSQSLEFNIDSQSPSGMSRSGSSDSDRQEENQTTAATTNINRGESGIVYTEIAFRGRHRQLTGRTFRRTRQEIDLILDAVEDLGILDDEAQEEILALAHVVPEYVEDWTLYKKYEGAKLGAGYYRLQVRERRRSPYVMGVTQRADYRRRKQEDWEMAEMERRATVPDTKE